VRYRFLFDLPAVTKIFFCPFGIFSVSSLLHVFVESALFVLYSLLLGTTENNNGNKNNINNNNR